MVPFNGRSPSDVHLFTNWPTYWEGKERQERGTNPSRLAGGRFKKQGNLLARLVLGAAR